jgi:hypothetical protein
MKEKFGLIQGVECKFVKTDPEIIDAIAKRQNIDSTKIKSMMRYNVFTIRQFADLSGLAVSSIINKTRPLERDGVLNTDLDYCYSHQDATDNGPKFIVRNSKAEKYLKA